MILKEAFRMQNHLTELMNHGIMFLSNKSNVTDTVEEHLRKKSNPNDEDEKLVVKKDTDYKANDVIDFVIDVLAEKEKLSKAIAKAKTSAEKDIDSVVALNKCKQGVIHTLKSLNDLRPTERKSIGFGFLINNDGNQTKYQYDINTVSTIDFDRNKVKGILKRLQKETDEASLSIDTLNVGLNVEYDAKYDIGDSFEESLESFIASDN